MNLLLDENLLPSFRDILRSLGYSAQHVYDVGLDQTPDEDIVAFARKSGDTILTNDLDFSRIMALSKEEFLSLLLFALAP
jgi:predicted nuclease of predicted toxin-antitoxin system